MKRRLLIIVFAVIGLVSCCLLFACKSSCCSKTQTAQYEISLTTDGDYITIETGAQVDYTQYFTVKDKSGRQITVTKDMLDLSHVDTSAYGFFTVTLTIGNASKTAIFKVVPADGTPDTPGSGSPGSGSGSSGSTEGEDKFTTIVKKYSDSSKWNFAVDFTDIYDGEIYYEEYYEYLGDNVSVLYDDNGKTRLDYIKYDSSTDTVYYYHDKGDGTYEILDEDDADFDDYYYYRNLIDLSELKNFTFTKSGDQYKADDAGEAGNAILGKFEGYYWTELTVWIGTENIAKIVGVMDDGDTYQYEFSSFGSVSFTLPQSSGGSSTGGSPSSGTMEAQTYNPSTFDKENLQQKMAKVDVIGLPSTGTYKALVIPVQFKDNTITQTQLTDLNIAFNGTEIQTGWESVKTYYQKASYGKLNLSFDIQSVYNAKNNSAYYETYKEPYQYQGETYYTTGEEVILEEVLAYYESRLNLSDYDYNNDGYIDAVYLIYSASVDYSNDSFYWAYTTWYNGENTYDNLGAYFYFFAGFDFMYESTANDPGSGYDRINGLKVNASTFIHETGHLLGLDDYYDYYPDEGSNDGLGGADMMDCTVGDHNVYSKIMLGWLDPTIVNSTQTVTIKSSQAEADAILIPLNFNNSYFCEYLLIDLYSAQGLNALHASQANSYLYDGASYGVRIYHVSSSINKPFQSEFGSFTDNDNSMSANALIKLVEADGEKKFASTGGYAAASDLWKAGNKLSSAFPSYKRNDGKTVNFDIQIVSVSSTEATITVTFN